jgi:hypothetical protein
MAAGPPPPSTAAAAAAATAATAGEQDALDAATSAIRAQLSPFLRRPLASLEAELASPLDRARLRLAAAYAVGSLAFAVVRLAGEEVGAVGVKQDLARVREYFQRVETASAEAAARAQSRKRAEPDPPASSSAAPAAADDESDSEEEDVRDRKGGRGHGPKRRRNEKDAAFVLGEGNKKHGLAKMDALEVARTGSVVRGGKAAPTPTTAHLKHKG